MADTGYDYREAPYDYAEEAEEPAQYYSPYQTLWGIPSWIIILILALLALWFLFAIAGQCRQEQQLMPWRSPSCKTNVDCYNGQQCLNFKCTNVGAPATRPRSAVPTPVPGPGFGPGLGPLRGPGSSPYPYASAFPASSLASQPCPPGMQFANGKCLPTA
jgi:hypothetical protein